MNSIMLTAAFGLITSLNAFIGTEAIKENLEIKIIAEKAQSVAEGLKFSVELENNSDEAIQIRTVEIEPPFSFGVFNERGYDVNFYNHDYTPVKNNNRRIVIEGHGIVHLGDVHFMKYRNKNGSEDSIQGGIYHIEVYFSKLDELSGKLKAESIIGKSEKIIMK